MKKTDGKKKKNEQKTAVIKAVSSFIGKTSLSTNHPIFGQVCHSIFCFAGALVRLLLAVSQREPTCCNTVHFTILLGAYSATRTVCDRGLLSLMHIYEKNNAHMWEYR